MDGAIIMSKEVALIKSEAVVNVIIADDDYIQYIQNEYDAVVDLTGISPRPGIGWTYRDGVLLVPEEALAGEPEEEPTE